MTVDREHFNPAKSRKRYEEQGLPAETIEQMVQYDTILYNKSDKDLKEGLNKMETIGAMVE
jgi:hypothetical protein